MTELPINAQLVAGAIVLLRDEADLGDIYVQVAKLLPTWKDHYKNEESFHGTIRATLEGHSPQSAKWDASREALFERVSSGRYRVLYPHQRADAIAKGRSI